VLFFFWFDSVLLLVFFLFLGFFLWFCVFFGVVLVWLFFFFGLFCVLCFVLFSFFFFCFRFFFVLVFWVWLTRQYAHGVERYRGERWGTRWACRSRAAKRS